MLREDLENTARDAAQRQIRETIEYIRKICLLNVEAYHNLPSLKPINDSVSFYEEFDLGISVRSLRFHNIVEELRNSYACLLAINHPFEISVEMLMIVGQIKPDLKTASFCEHLKYWLETPTSQWPQDWRHKIKKAGQNSHNIQEF